MHFSAELLLSFKSLRAVEQQVMQNLTCCQKLILRCPGEQALYRLAEASHWLLHLSRSSRYIIKVLLFQHSDMGSP